jgi:toxic protein SymE
MRTEPVEKKTGDNKPIVRNLKIQPKFRNNLWSQTISPEIKLCGKWLEKLGFECGKRVEVTVSEDLLIVRVKG